MPISPRFEVEKINGNFTRIVHRLVVQEVKVLGPGGERTVTTRSITPQEETFKEAYMVYMPNGSSILVACDDHEQINRLGFLDEQNQRVSLSDDFTDDGVVVSPKQIVLKNTRNRSPVDAAMNG